MLRRPLILATAAALFLLGAACTSEDDATPTPTESPTAAATLEAVTDLTLQSATIPTDLVPAGEVNLQGGEATIEGAGGAEFSIANTVIDDFNDDGVDDGALVLRSSGGGSGTFYDLHVFLAAEGGPELVASEFLGDRIEVQGIESGPGGVTVVYLARESDAPMTAEPTIETTVRVEIGSDGSISVSGSAESTAQATEVASPAPTEVASEDACADLSPEAADAAFTFVANLQSGDTLESGTSVEGCSRTFESNVPWRLEDREGNVIAESFAMGGGVDGPAPYAFIVEYEVDEPQVGHLFVGGDDPSGGEGFPPVLNQIPVVLLP